GLDLLQLALLLLGQAARVGVALGELLRLLVHVELLGPQRLELGHRRDAVGGPHLRALLLGLLLIFGRLLRLLLGLLVLLGQLLLDRVQEMIQAAAGLLLVFYRLLVALA